MENENIRARSWPRFARFHVEMNHLVAERAQNQPGGNGATSILPWTMAGLDAPGFCGGMNSFSPIPSFSWRPLNHSLNPIVRQRRATNGFKLVAKATSGCPLVHGPRGRTKHLGRAEERSQAMGSVPETVPTPMGLPLRCSSRSRAKVSPSTRNQPLTRTLPPQQPLNPNVSLFTLALPLPSPPLFPVHPQTDTVTHKTPMQKLRRRRDFGFSLRYPCVQPGNVNTSRLSRFDSCLGIKSRIASLATINLCPATPPESLFVCLSEQEKEQRLRWREAGATSTQQGICSPVMGADGITLGLLQHLQCRAQRAQKEVGLG